MGTKLKFMLWPDGTLRVRPKRKRKRIKLSPKRRTDRHGFRWYYLVTIPAAIPILVPLLAFYHLLGVLGIPDPGAPARPRGGDRVRKRLTPWKSIKHRIVRPTREDGFVGGAALASGALCSIVFAGILHYYGPEPRGRGTDDVEPTVDGILFADLRGDSKTIHAGGTEI